MLVRSFQSKTDKPGQTSDQLQVEVRKLSTHDDAVQTDFDDQFKHQQVLTTLQTCGTVGQGLVVLWGRILWYSGTGSCGTVGQGLVVPVGQYCSTGGALQWPMSHVHVHSHHASNAL